jgi:serine protease Do
VTGATPKVISFNRAIQIVSPSVVGINTSGAQQLGASGIIVHPQGYILTNDHVVKGASNVVVTIAYDKLVKAYPAQLVDSRPDLDLALIKVTGTGGQAFSPAPLGDSGRILIGQQVVAIGNPFGLAQSASAGIISNARRTLTAGNKVFDGLIQTDASINPGSSGGALVNAKAEVIGVSTAIYSPLQAFTGVGFAVPINQAKQAFGGFIQAVPSPLATPNAWAAGANMNAVNVPVTRADLQMMAAGTGVTRCWLGIDVHPVDRVVAREFDVPVSRGVLVNRVFDNSPASRAGLLRGDVIFRVNRARVRDARMFWSHLAQGKPGDKVRITLFRRDRKKTFVLKLEPEPPNIRALLSKAPQGAAAGAAGAAGIEEISWVGIDVQPLTDPEALQEFGISPTEKGVLVGEVEGVAAIDAGLQPGDLIRKINNHEVRDIRAFKEVIKRVNPSKGIVLDIVRQRRPFYVTIQPLRQDRGAWQ